MVCINKWELHPEMSAEIEKSGKAQDVELLGKISFDPW